MGNSIKRTLSSPIAWVAFGFLVFQYWILFSPQQPHLERPTHLIFALFLTFLAVPLKAGRIPKVLARTIDALCLVGTLAVAAYYWMEMSRLQTRIENVSPILWYDIAIAITLVVLLIEGIRRTVGNILVAVVAAFLLYGAFGYLVPGTFGFSGLSLEEFSEILAMTTGGILGVTTETSVNFIFYFIVFGVVYSAVGGGEFFIDMAMRMVGKTRGGGSKVAIIGSSLMGTISGSAVANVTATGVFTIPLMRKTGISGERAAATEAIASTGGQLMPPIMGIAAFVMAELLVTPYSQIALAGVIPAVAFYFALFVGADLHARKHGVGTLTDEDFEGVTPVLPRIHMASPPLILVLFLIMGYSAQIAVVYATVSCLVVPFFRRETWYSPLKLPQMIVDSGRQAALIAVPIAAIGIVIAVAIQSNLALKFASGLISAGGGSYVLSLVMVILGCIIMGMGLPTVAAYIIGAILYVPALEALNVEPLQAHFFVMYFCVLSMVTPPVSLASFAAAGVACTDAMRTSLVAFRMCAVAFLIPFAFIADDALLFRGSYLEIAIAGAGLILSTVIWSMGIVGFIVRNLNVVERVFLLLCGAGAMVTPTGSLVWIAGTSLSILYLVFHVVTAKAGAEKSPSLEASARKPRPEADGRARLGMCDDVLK
ncbi:TRAP transporter permease [Marinobacterium aestuariivivens]|uniref:TRAP transporter permease n=1 Tax=Marinobacterium aestuariivivens TaxID=1698799 RepID=A0ABW2A168_9GAMM